MLSADFDFSAIASEGVTKGFSGSDLRNVCIAAAYKPLRDYLAQVIIGEGRCPSGVVLWSHQVSVGCGRVPKTQPVFRSSGRGLSFSCCIEWLRHSPTSG